MPKPSRRRVGPLADVESLDDYLLRFGPVLGQRLLEAHEPLYDPQNELPHPRLASLLRRPYPAQADAITALARAFAARRGLFLVGELGTGKTLMAAGVMQVLFPRAFRALVMCPGHLVRKWRREILTTLPDVTVETIRSVADCLRLEATGRPKASRREVWLVSRDRAKLSFAWRPAVLTRPGHSLCFCPRCRAPQVDRYGTPLGRDHFERSKRKCVQCREPLWQADPRGPRRYAPAEFIGRRLSGWFDLFVADETHELKGASTAQGNALGRLASAACRTLTLTGTLAGGYASNLQHLIARIGIESLRAEGLEYADTKQWIERYGVLETITVTPREWDNRMSRGGAPRTSVRERPGISPQLFGRHLLDRAVFIELADLALNLPPLHEEVRSIPMDPDLAAAYRRLEQDLKAAVRDALRKGSRGLLSTYLHTLLAYPDKPYGFPPIRDPEHPEVLVTIPETLPEDFQYGKERALLDLVNAERAQGRRVFVYAVYAERHDVVGRLSALLRQAGVRAEALRATVPPEEREEWLERAVRRGVEVVVANPALVQTGLDLIEFRTLVFYETGYSIYLVRQASRRSWRIGQTRPVRVVYLCYRGTMQERALQLMARKLVASLALEGKFSGEGLLALAEGSDLATELARSLVKGLEGLDSAEAIWRKLSPPAPSDPAQVEPVAPARTSPDPEATCGPASVIVTPPRGRRGSVRTLAVEELDGITGQLGFAWLAEETAAP